MHPLLTRQMRKYPGAAHGVEGPLKGLLDAVSRAYTQADSDRAMMERVLELTSADLLEANRNLKQTVSLLSATLDATGDAVLVVDHRGHVAAYNERLSELLGLVGRNLTGEDANPLLTRFSTLVSCTGDFVERTQALALDPDAVITIPLALEDGRHLEMHTQPQKIHGRTVGRVWSFHDITDLKMAEATIRHTAYHDPLTGLPNRALFEDRFRIALAQARRAQSSVGLFFIDLDGFKLVNDSLGHSAGDELLKVVARRLGAHVREGDTLARFGGDEFVFVVSNVRSSSAAQRLAARMIESVRPPVEIGGHTLRISASIGIAFYPTDSLDAESLIRHADTALYIAKDLGRNTFQLYNSDLGERAGERIKLESELRVALDRHELSVVYQPQVCAQTGRTLGLEALSRWPRDGEAVSPGVFVPIAEAAGIMEELGINVFQNCMNHYPEWRARFGRDIGLSINVSPLQIQRPGFSHTIMRLLDGTGLPPDSIELEVTESALMQSRGAGIRALNELAMLGFRIALDDFGTGYSSLSQLRELPLTTLKIDREFVKRCHESPADRELIYMMVRMARSLGLTIVAEGAEFPEQVSFLKEVGCDLIQGFATGKPMDHWSIFMRLEHERLAARRVVVANAGARADGCET